MQKAKSYAVCLPALFTLAACGGGGSSGVAVVTPPVVPAVITPPAAPTSDFETTEYTSSIGLSEIKAIPAYEAGLTGAGVIIGVADTGLDIDNREFEGRVHADSFNFIEGGVMIDPAGHGTGVTGIIAAAKDDFGTHGVAYGATILALRVCDGTSGNSCTAPGDLDDTPVTDRVIAALDHAVAAGSSVINFSLSWAETDFRDQAHKDQLHDAMERAVDAGVLLVFASGNGFADDPQEIIANWALEDGLKNGILMVGSTDRKLELFDRSNAAGFAADVFVVAPAEVRSTYNGGGTSLTSDGTSYAAPHVVGAAALLFEMFPNLTGKQVGELLLKSATDLGAVGVDNVYGYGLINLEAAIQPVGGLTFSTTGASSLGLNNTALKVPASFGDAFSSMVALNDVMMVDDYDRSYFVDLQYKISTTGSISPNIGAILSSSERYIGSGLRLSNESAFSFSGERQLYSTGSDLFFAHPPYGSSQALLSPRGEFHFAPSEKTEMKIGFGGDAGMSIYQSPASDREPISLARRTNAYGAFALNSSSQVGGSVTHAVSIDGDISLAVSQQFDDATNLQSQFNMDKSKTSLMKVGYSHYLNHGQIGFNLGYMREENAVLGSRSKGGLSLANGARSTFGVINADYALGNNISLYGEYMRGFTQLNTAANSLFQDISAIETSAWRFQLNLKGALKTSDELTLAISQPLRVEGGNISMSMAISRDYIANVIKYQMLTEDLKPSGREIDLEAGYRFLSLGGLNFDLGVLYQHEPGHISANKDTVTGFARFQCIF